MKKIKRETPAIEPQDDGISQMSFEEKLEKVNSIKKSNHKNSELIKKLDKEFNDKIKELKKAFERLERIYLLLRS